MQSVDVDSKDNGSFVPRLEDELRAAFFTPLCTISARRLRRFVLPRKFLMCQPGLTSQERDCRYTICRRSFRVRPIRHMRARKSSMGYRIVCVRSFSAASAAVIFSNLACTVINHTNYVLCFSDEELYVRFHQCSFQ